MLTRRKLLASLAASAGAAATLSYSAAQEPSGSLGTPQPIEIEARPIPHFFRSNASVRRFGELEFRGGLVLTSPSQQFGGWSGLVVGGDGRKLLSVSDKGSWLTGDLHYRDERLVGFSNGRIGALRARSGRSLDAKREQDAESVALLNGTLHRGTLLIGFERLHRIGRFEIRDGELSAPSSYMGLPAAARGMRANQGIEALAVIQAGPLRGSVVAFAERFTRGSGYHTGWFWVRGRPQSIHLQDIDGFDITDAAGTPDGGLLILERYFRWTTGVKMRIRRIAPGEIRPGARIAGRTLLQADAGYEIDNMEGMAIHRDARGTMIVSLISDDNFNRFLQRTVFLQFALADE